MTPTSGADAIFARRASRKRVMTAESDGDEAEHGSDAVRASMSFWRSAEETALLMAKVGGGVPSLHSPQQHQRRRSYSRQWPGVVTRWWAQLRIVIQRMSWPSSAGWSSERW